MLCSPGRALMAPALPLRGCGSGKDACDCCGALTWVCCCCAAALAAFCGTVTSCVAVVCAAPPPGNCGLVQTRLFPAGAFWVDVNISLRTQLLLLGRFCVREAMYPRIHQVSTGGPATCERPERHAIEARSLIGAANTGKFSECAAAISVVCRSLWTLFARRSRFRWNVRVDVRSCNSGETGHQSSSFLPTSHHPIPQTSWSLRRLSTSVTSGCDPALCAYKPHMFQCQLRCLLVTVAPAKPTCTYGIHIQAHAGLQHVDPRSPGHMCICTILGKRMPAILATMSHAVPWTAEVIA